MLPFLFVAACSLPDTLIARDIIQEKLNPLLLSLKVKNYELSSACPFKNIEQRDILRNFEKNINKQTPFIWECKLCDKQFRTEENIYRHILNSHSISDQSKDLCMADLCHFIPCQNDPIVRHRCAAVAQQCFRDEVAEEVIHQFCYSEIEDPAWNFSMNLGVYVSLGCVSGLFCFIYYMIIWGEHEAGIHSNLKKPKSKSKNKLKTK